MISYGHLGQSYPQYVFLQQLPPYASLRCVCGIDHNHVSSSIADDGDFTMYGHKGFPFPYCRPIPSLRGQWVAVIQGDLGNARLYPILSPDAMLWCEMTVFRGGHRAAIAHRSLASLPKPQSPMRCGPCHIVLRILIIPRGVQQMPEGRAHPVFYRFQGIFFEGIYPGFWVNAFHQGLQRPLDVIKWIPFSAFVRSAVRPDFVSTRTPIGGASCLRCTG
jgi:hypothetical protein